MIQRMFTTEELYKIATEVFQQFWKAGKEDLRWTNSNSVRDTRECAIWMGNDKGGVFSEELVTVQYQYCMSINNWTDEYSWYVEIDEVYVSGMDILDDEYGFYMEQHDVNILSEMLNGQEVLI